MIPVRGVRIRGTSDGRQWQQMSRGRKGEEERTWFRAGRIFREGDAWFVATREGIDVGPFESEEQARQNAERLVEILERTTSPVEALIAIREFRDRPRV